jgi:hypothetical protein
MGVRGYGLRHIIWAINVEESGLCTQDFLDKQASLVDKNYLTGERFQEDVERARHFIFDEPPLLGGTEFQERLIYHLRNFTDNEDEIFMLANDIMRIVTKSS